MVISVEKKHRFPKLSSTFCSISFSLYHKCLPNYLLYHLIHHYRQLQSFPPTPSVPEKIWQHTRIICMMYFLTSITSNFQFQTVLTVLSWFQGVQEQPNRVYVSRTKKKQNKQNPKAWHHDSWDITNIAHIWCTHYRIGSTLSEHFHHFMENCQIFQN